MGLLTKEMEINITRVWRYYEGLGYNIPKTEKIYYHKNGSVKHRRMTVTKGTMLMVKIEDVPKNNCNKVDVECDCCKKQYSLKYQTYNQIVDYEEKVYCRDCYGKFRMIGDKNPKWNLNKTDEERKVERKYPEYTAFVRRVLVRDNYTCQCCGKKSSEDLEVHHLDGYDWCVEKRIDDTNGITLCEDCHSNFHCHYGWGGNTKKQFEEWFGETVNLVRCGIKVLPTKRIYCIEEDKLYDSAKSFAKIKQCSDSNVYSCCNHMNGYTSILGLHLLWEEEYLNMSKIEIQQYVIKISEKSKRNYNYLKGKLNPKAKKVVCINTLEVFDTITQASNHYNAKDISRCCLGKKKSAGKLPETKEPLKWMYYEDYIKKNDTTTLTFLTESSFLLDKNE